MSAKPSSRVPRVLCSELPTPQRAVLLDSEEANHLQQVLRLKNGAPVIALNGRGQAIPAYFFVQDKKIYVQAQESAVLETRSREQELSKVVLEVAVLKGDSMSWVIEKAVELGVEAIVPILSDHAVIQIEKKGLEHFLERWQRIADQSLKQCERLYRLKIEPPRSLEELLRSPLSSEAARFIAVEPKGQGFGASPAETLRPELFLRSPVTHWLIGPEGGWSNSELQLFEAESARSRVRRVSLGPLVLRAETAAIFVISCARSARLHN